MMRIGQRAGLAWAASLSGAEQLPAACHAQGRNADAVPSMARSTCTGHGEPQFPPPPARNPVKAADPGIAGWARADRQRPRSNRHTRERVVTPDKHRWWRPLNIIVLT